MNERRSDKHRIDRLKLWIAHLRLGMGRSKLGTDAVLADFGRVAETHLRGVPAGVSLMWRGDAHRLVLHRAKGHRQQTPDVLRSGDRWVARVWRFNLNRSPIASSNAV